MNYQDYYRNSVEHPEEFWMHQATKLEWIKAPQIVRQETANGASEWFPDGTLNLCDLCVDRHVRDGYGSQVAIYYDSPVTNTKQTITYTELQEQVSKLAGALQELGLTKGDTAIIYMPMIPQAIFCMLACVRLGIIHSVVFGGFAPKELAIRIDDCNPKVILTASNGIEIAKNIPYKPFVDEAISLASHKPDYTIIYDRNLGSTFDTNDNDLDYEEIVSRAARVAPVPVTSNHPSYILYTSGTTGTPKGIVRDTGGYATALKYSMEAIYGVAPGEVYWAASDVGWVVGHSYIVYGPLLNRNSTVLFEGKPIKTPDASTFWRVISEYKVATMFTAPTAIRAIKKEDPNGEFIKKFDMSSLRFQFLAGERCDVATLKWAEEHLKVPVIDHWWQTESGWPMLANMAGEGLFELKPGSAGKPVCGYQMEIINNDGNPAMPNEEGLVMVKLPLPPGCLLNVWGNPERFINGYLKPQLGYYFSGDGGYRDEDGYMYITGRVDDVINVAGHRLSTSEMEEIVASHPAVAECAVFGIHCDLKGQRPVGLAVLKSGTDISPKQLQEEVVQMVRSGIGAVAYFKELYVVQRLPKTRSGKILRRLLRHIADGVDYSIPSTIDDVNIIPEIEEIFKNKIVT